VKINYLVNSVLVECSMLETKDSVSGKVCPCLVYIVHVAEWRVLSLACVMHIVVFLYIQMCQVCLTYGTYLFLYICKLFASAEHGMFAFVVLSLCLL